MRTAAIIAIALTSAAAGAAMSGWIVSSHQIAPPGGLMSTNIGYSGPAGVPVGAPPAQIPFAGLGIRNPYENSPQAVATGKRLYEAMNCAGCHGYKGKGNMGPDLTDGYWRYGGTPVQIYKSIYEGRPKGMPAWGSALPADQIWALTAYITSLGGTPEDSDAGDAGRGSNADRGGGTGSNSAPSSAPKPSKSGAGTEGQ